VAASPNAEWIASAAQSGIVTVWDMRKPLTPVPHVLTEGHDWQATTAAYFGGGSRLVTSGGDNSTVVWDTRLGNQLLKIGGAKEQVGTGWRGVAAASHHGKWIATGSWKAGDPRNNEAIAAIWDAESGRLVLTLPRSTPESATNPEPSEATAIAFAPDDQTVFVGDQWGNCTVYSTADGQPMKSFIGHKAKVSAAGFLPSGRLLTASSDRTVAKWNLPEVDEKSPQPELTLPHGDRVVAMDVAPDGTRVVTASDATRDLAVLHLWNPETGEEIYRLAYEELRRVLKPSNDGDQKPIVVRSVALHPSEPHALVTVFDPNTVYDPNRKQSPYQVGRWDWQKDQRPFVQQLSQLDDTSLAVYAKDRPGAILTVGGRGARVRLANQANEVVMSYRPQTGVQSVSFSRSGKLLAAAGSDGSIKLWRLDEATSQWTPERKLMGQHRGAVNSVVFHPTDDGMLLTAGADGTARLWQRAGDEWKATPFDADGQTSALNAAIFALGQGDQTTQVIAACEDGTVRIWNLAGEPVGAPLKPEGPAGPVRCLAISGDGKWIVASIGINAFAWSRDELESNPIPLVGHWADITSMKFSTDGQRLVTTGRDFNVKLWDATSWRVPAADQVPESQRELLTLEGHSDGVMGVAFFASPTFPSIVTAGEDGQVILWPSLSWEADASQFLGRR
jgi:WD40 repeat protein